MEMEMGMVSDAVFLRVPFEVYDFGTRRSIARGNVYGLGKGNSNSSSICMTVLEK